MFGRVGVVAAAPALREGFAVLAGTSHDGPDVVSLELVPSSAEGFAVIVVGERLLTPNPVAALRALELRCEPARIVPLILAIDDERMLLIQQSSWGVLCAEDNADPLVRGLTEILSGIAHIPDRVAWFMDRRRADARIERPAVALTRRELEVMRLAADGLRDGQIGSSLYISESTTKTHLRHVYEKLGVGNRTAAVSKLIALGALSAGSGLV